jgi:hypothetical protein
MVTSPAFAQPGRTNNGGYNGNSYKPMPRKITYGNRNYSDGLATDLVDGANYICNIMYDGYQRNRNFNEVYRDAYSLVSEAKQIRAAVKDGVYKNPRRDDDRITISLHILDRKFHELEKDLRSMRPDPNPRAPRESAQLAQALDQFEDTLHDMMEDYGIKTRWNGNGPGNNQPNPHNPPGMPNNYPGMPRR